MSKKTVICIMAIVVTKLVTASTHIRSGWFLADFLVAFSRIFSCEHTCSTAQVVKALKSPGRSWELLPHRSKYFKPVSCRGQRPQTIHSVSLKIVNLGNLNTMSKSNVNKPKAYTFLFNKQERQLKILNILSKNVPTINI